jgi:peptide-methionine (S)-S-oxide reductase
MRIKYVWLILVALVVVGLCVFVLVQGEFIMSEKFPVLEPGEIATVRLPAAPAGAVEVATFGSGCFWCTEAVFQQLRGVQKVVSGYTGGSVKNPTYEQVRSGSTGHAEVVQVTYDPNVISYPQLLEVFWRTHDPTTLNRQGNDIGTQYRSVIFYHSESQRQLAELYKEKIDAAGVFRAPLVTDIDPATEFYPAEGYHQNYYVNNTNQMYCRAMIGPKLDKLKKVFHDKLK